MTIKEIRVKLRDFITGELRRRRESEEEKIRMEEADDFRLAKNPYLSLREYERLATHPFSFVRIALVYSCGFFDIIDMLSKDPNPIVRSAAFEKKRNIFSVNLRNVSPETEKEKFLLFFYLKISRYCVIKIKK